MCHETLTFDLVDPKSVPVSQTMYVEILFVPHLVVLGSDIPVTETQTDTEMIDINNTHTETNTEKIFNTDTIYI